jgi:hypothetical protein
MRTFVNAATAAAGIDDPSIYPPPEVKSRLRPNLAKSPKFTRNLNRTWTRFTTSR